MAEDKTPPVALDAARTKALAHPLRLAMYHHILDHGPQTSAQLARAMEESTGQTSYHLRQMAKHGIVTEVPDRGTARERWWDAVGLALDSVTPGEDPAETRAINLLARGFTEWRVLEILEWTERIPREDEAWVNQTTSTSGTGELTQDELHALSGDLERVVEEHLTRASEARKAEGARASESPGTDDRAPPEGRPATRKIRVHVITLPLAE